MANNKVDAEAFCRDFIEKCQVTLLLIPPAPSWNHGLITRLVSIASNTSGLFYVHTLRAANEVCLRAIRGLSATPWTQPLGCTTHAPKFAASTSYYKAADSPLGNQAGPHSDTGLATGPFTSLRTLDEGAC